jgi:hypothetical protein
MIEGVIVVNGLTPPRATRVRTELWDAVTAVSEERPDARVA